MPTAERRLAAREGILDDDQTAALVLQAGRDQAKDSTPFDYHCEHYRIRIADQPICPAVVPDRPGVTACNVFRKNEFDVAVGLWLADSIYRSSERI